MRALSLWQPWAAAMACGAKKIETRSWHTSYTGVLAIHASKKEIDLAELPGMVRIFAHAASPMPYGAIVCVVMLYECWPTERLDGLLNPINKGEVEFGDYSPGRFCWVTRNFRKLNQPVPCRGRQGLWILDAETEAAVNAQLLPK